MPAIFIFFLLGNVSAKERIVVGYYEFKPLVFQTTEGKPAGLYIDMLEHFARENSLELSYRFGSWSECLQRVKAGEVDLVPVTVYTAERARYMDFTEVPLFVDWVVAYCKPDSKINTIMDLDGKRIAALKDSILTTKLRDMLEQFGVKAFIQEESEYETMFDLLDEGKCDVAICTNVVGLQYEQNRNIERSQIVFAPVKIVYGAPKDRLKALLDKMDAHFKALKKDKKSYFYSCYDYWMNMQRSKYPRWLLWSIAALLAVCILLGGASYVLRRIVRLRTAQLTCSNLEWENTFDSISDLVAIIDSDYRVLRGNSAFKREFPRRKITETTCCELIHDTDAPLTACPCRQAFTSGKEQHWEFKEPHLDGRWFDVSLFPIKNAESRVIRLVHLATDISNRKQIEEKIRQMEKMDAVGHLAGGIAHDFNNQLACILGYAEMLGNKVENDELKGYTECILHATRQAGALTKKLLAFARKGNYEYAVVDIHEMIDELIEILSHTIDKRIKIKKQLHAKYFHVLGDSSQIQNALLNLAINARDAMPEGGVLKFKTNQIFRETQAQSDLKQGDYICISVSDTGCGIDSETCEHIFEPFFTTKEAGKGTGMGLAVVYGTVKQLGGSVNVKSKLGEGTTFEIYLPLTDLEEQALPEIPEDNDKEMSAHVLVVDDEELFRQMAHEMLNNMGFSVVSRSNGAAGVDYYKEHWQEIDLVILDMIMPELDGRDAFRAIKKINPEAKVLIASGYSVDGAVEELLNEGAVDYVHKPFEHNTIKHKLQNILKS